MTSRMFPAFTSFIVATLIACGGAQPSQTTTPPANATDPTAAAPAATDSAAPATAGAPAQAAKPGPNLTPAGVVFNFKPDGNPSKIFLAGSFNDWNPANPKYLLKNDGPNGMWTITVKLVPGTYQYKFVADGQWIKDPNSPGSAPDGYGAQNGQFDVK